MSFEIIVPFLKPIEYLLDGKTVSEIMVNPDGSVWIEEAGQIQSLPNSCFDEDALRTDLEVIANKSIAKAIGISRLPGHDHLSERPM